MLKPDRKKFGADPFGYSALAWHQWGTAQIIAGFSVEPKVAPTSADLKDPILWVTQATALSEAAKILLRTEPSWEHMPLTARGMCDSQYCAAALMLVGYSLEVGLKGMQIIKKGIEVYTNEERSFLHHRLEDLAELVPNLDAKDKAILRLLTHFTTWAGRYPDPGKKFESSASEIFNLSEKNQLNGRDLFVLASKVMNHMQVVVNE
ncbi:hypothetical protein [Polaromonas sp. SM01]|uniref:hypothetical protein n=1 Tax=Polaromonas sp. SM01 TaxID=3085630 RepID=UPI00298164C4|nr:hypothetical protein [Polaromonas sp. SM01]MDW5445183.1 hypothetical protein [Polaromonas sp. SM01]